MKNVPGYDGILIHVGYSDKWSRGCILVGENSESNKLSNSADALERLYSYLEKANEITIEIVRKYEMPLVV